MRMIINYTLIDEYRLKFFPKESIACSCSNYSIKIRRYILFECLRFTKCWNSKKESIIDIIIFLEFNPEAFYFQNNVLA